MHHDEMDVFGWQMFLEVFRDCCRCQLPQTLMSVRCNARITRWWQLKHFWNFHPDPLGVLFVQFDGCICFQNGWGNFPTRGWFLSTNLKQDPNGILRVLHPPPFEHPPSEPYNQLYSCYWQLVDGTKIRLRYRMIVSFYHEMDGEKNSITPHDKYLHEWRNKKFYCSLPKVKGLPVWNPQGQCVK